MEKSEMEELLKTMIRSGMDMTQYKRGATKLVVPLGLLESAKHIMESNFPKSHEIEVKFDE